MFVCAKWNFVDEHKWTRSAATRRALLSSRAALFRPSTTQCDTEPRSKTQSDSLARKKSATIKSKMKISQHRRCKFTLVLYFPLSSCLLWHLTKTYCETWFSIRQFHYSPYGSGRLALLKSSCFRCFSCLSLSAFSCFEKWLPLNCVPRRFLITEWPAQTRPPSAGTTRPAPRKEGKDCI